MSSVPTNVVTVPRESEEKESEIQELFGKDYTEENIQIVEEPIGTIAHIDCLTSQYDLRNIFYISVTKVLRELAFVKIDKITSPVMSTLLRKANAIDFNLKLAKERLQIACEFLKKDNLYPMYEKMFQMHIVSRADLKHYETFINSLQ